MDMRRELEAWKTEREAMLAKRKANGWTTGTQLEHAARDRDDIRRIEKILGLGNKYPDGKVQRLQAAVKEMLAELNAYAESKLWGFDGYDGQDVVSIEDYGLTPEDMEP